MSGSISLLLMFVVYMPFVLPTSGRLQIYLNEKLVMFALLVTQVHVGMSWLLKRLYLYGATGVALTSLIPSCPVFLLPLNSRSCGLSRHCKYVFAPESAYLGELCHSCLLITGVTLGNSNGGETGIKIYSFLLMCNHQNVASKSLPSPLESQTTI